MPRTKRPSKKGKAKKPAQQSAQREDMQDHTLTPQPQQSANAFIMKLSTEIRFEIFEHIVPRDGTIEIRTLVKKKDLMNPLPPLSAHAQDFLALRLANKEIYEEASTLYYSCNRFIIGNGEYGSTRSINIQALQRFIACIPSQHLAQIRMLGMPLYIRHPPFCYDGFYFNSDGSRYLARSMMKTFTGVTNLLFYVPDNQPHVSLNSQAFWTQKMSDEWRNKWGMLIQDEKLQDFVQSLLKHEKLENIIAGITLDNEEVQESLQSIVEGSETAERVTITQVVRPIRRRLWGLEGISRL